MTDTTTALDLDLDAIRRREQAADSGPWRVVEEPGRITIQTAIRYGESSEIAEMVSSDNFEPWASKLTEENAEFIAAARQDIPALLAEVDRLRAALATEMNRRNNQARQALLDYRDNHHRPNGKATGYCICGDTWDHDEPCDEYQGLTDAAREVSR